MVTVLPDEAPKPKWQLFELNGDKWQIYTEKCHNETAQRLTSSGLDLASKEELQSLSRRMKADENFKITFSFLFGPEEAVWSNERLKFENKLFVVKFATGEVDAWVPDFPAYVVVKQRNQ